MTHDLIADSFCALSQTLSDLVCLDHAYSLQDPMNIHVCLLAGVILDSISSETLVVETNNMCSDSFASVSDLH